MNNRCLLTILLVGMSLSACAPFEHYRTNLTEVFECTVDHDSVTETLVLCEDRGSTNTHAIQHRRYTGNFDVAFASSVPENESSMHKIKRYGGDVELTQNRDSMYAANYPYLVVKNAIL